MSDKSLSDLKDALRTFAAERDWEKFHTPKNLAMALAVEVGELIEHFQWLTGDESRSLTPQKLDQVEEELADVFIYLVKLSDTLGVDLIDAAFRKIAINSKKYPAKRVRGSAKKYTEY